MSEKLEQEGRFGGGVQNGIARRAGLKATALRRSRKSLDSIWQSASAVLSNVLATKAKNSKQRSQTTGVRLATFSEG